MDVYTCMCTHSHMCTHAHMHSVDYTMQTTMPDPLIFIT